jgi:hypothetical protein
MGSSVSSDGNTNPGRMNIAIQNRDAFPICIPMSLIRESDGKPPQYGFCATVRTWPASMQAAPVASIETHAKFTLSDKTTVDMIGVALIVDEKAGQP